MSELSFSPRSACVGMPQEIAEACTFLGADGLLVPSARENQSRNPIVFCEQETRIVKEIVRNHGVVDLS